MTRSLYTILNVAPDADPAVVEAAYKALMKKYHPDVRTEDPDSSRQRAAEINEAFHILKDPAKRAEYDSSERLRREAVLRSVVVEPPRRFAPPMPPPPTRRRHSKWPALFMIAAAAVAVFFIWRGSDAAIGEEPGLPAIFARAQGGDGTLAPVRAADVNRAVAEFSKIKDRSGLIGLSAFSHDCFAAQSRSERESDFDFCVAFDKAALTYGIDLPAPDYLPRLPRFEAAEVGRRHAAAGKLLSSDENLIGNRVAEIANLTSQRLQALSQPPAPAAAQTAAAAAAAPAVVKTARSYRQPRAARARTAQGSRQQRPRQQRDPDFLEREGYIY